MENKNRLGTIQIAKGLVHDFELMSMVFSRFIPVSCSYCFLEDKFTYKGYSPEFEKVKEGCQIPLYDAVASWNDGEVSLKFEVV